LIPDFQVKEKNKNATAIVKEYSAKDCQHSITSLQRMGVL
jgi:hypothetical protein